MTIRMKCFVNGVHLIYSAHARAPLAGHKLLVVYVVVLVHHSMLVLPFAEIVKHVGAARTSPQLRAQNQLPDRRFR